jgi:hypothetical protein
MLILTTTIRKLQSHIPKRAHTTFGNDECGMEELQARVTKCKILFGKEQGTHAINYKMQCICIFNYLLFYRTSLEQV